MVIFEFHFFDYMKSIDINNKLIEGYLKLLENLSPANKLDLISKLTESVKADLEETKKRFHKSFGAWEGSESAEKIISDIKNSRTFNRQIEEL